MNFKQPLFWHQGLFLQPQHFQYNHHHAEQRDIQFAKISTDYPWGITHLTFDEMALSQGQVEVKSMELLFEDGTLVDYPANVHLRPRSFNDAWADRSKPLNVYVCLTKLDENNTNVTEVNSFDSAPDVTTRYISLVEGENINDFHQGDNTAQIKKLKYVLRIVFEDELASLGEHVALPIASIEQQDGDARYAADYIAPSMTLKSAPSLVKLIKDIRDELIGRAKQLENYKSSNVSRTSEFNPVAERYRSALSVLARYAPLLNHYLENSMVHPVSVYGKLRTFIGELSTFSDKFNLLGESSGAELDLPRYQHSDIYFTFNSAKKIILSLLDELTVSPELLVRFDSEGTGRFSCDLPSEFFSKQNSMYLILDTSSSYSDYKDSFNNFSKLGAVSQIDIFVQRAIPGLSFTHLDEQPSGLERRARVVYFSLDRDSEKWKEVEEQGSFALQWDDAPSDLVVEMVLVRDE